MLPEDFLLGKVSYSIWLKLFLKFVKLRAALGSRGDSGSGVGHVNKIL